MNLNPVWQHRLTRLVEGLIGITFLAAAVILWRWFRDGGGLEAVYVAIGVLLAALFTARRWLQAAAKPAASQHAGWGASTQGHNEMSALRQQMAQSLSLDDLRSLTFDLNLNFDNLAGETLERKIISLLESCRRQNLLPLLLTHLQAQRPHIAWAQVSALPAATTPQAQRNRENLLNNVQTAWIDGFLKQSLHSEVIKLSLSYRPEAVGQRPWQLILKQTGQPDAPVSPDETLLDIFTAAGRNLLILGEPGSGKTITLLQLAEALIALARQDPAEPLPIILNLSSWARERPPLSDWLVEEMFVQYGVARDLTRAGIAQNQFLYLLDGLDEVAAEARDACVTALNAFKAAFPAELVVCSRAAEYASLQAQLHLGAAIQIKPLTEAQIEAYLAREGAELAAVRTTLAHDAELRELAQSPLMLSLMTLAYRGETAIDLRPRAGKETRRQHLFAHYVQKMFERRPLPPDSPYTQEQALSWLATIARGMKEHDQSVFYIERLQPTWLGNGRWRFVFSALNYIVNGLVQGGIVGALIGLVGSGLVTIVGLAFVEMLTIILGHEIIAIFAAIGSGFLFWIASTLLGSVVGVISGALTAIFHGVFFVINKHWERSFLSQTLVGILSATITYRLFRSLITLFIVDFDATDSAYIAYTVTTIIYLTIIGLFMGRSVHPSESIFLVEKVQWKPTLHLKIKEFVSENIKVAISILLGIGIYAVIEGPGLLFALSFFGLPMLIAGYLWEGIQVINSTQYTHTTNGIKLTQNNARRVGWVLGGVVAASAGIIWGLLTLFVGPDFWLIVIFLFHGLLVGLPSGFMIGAYHYGGKTAIQHYLLRFLLARKFNLPLKDKGLEAYLDDMNARILFRKIGSGWIFVHRSLLEHFATL